MSVNDNIYLAHVKKINDEEEITQTVRDHCKAVAEYTAENLKEVNLYNVGYLAGLLHDLGKSSDAFKTYIIKASSGEEVVRGSVNHTFAGVVYLLERYHKKDVYDEMTTAEIISWAIGSHHGQFDCCDLDNANGFLHRLNYDKEKISYNQVIESFLSTCKSEDEIDKLFKLANEEISTAISKYKNDAKRYIAKDGDIVHVVYFFISMLSRLLLSALIDADRRDTEEFMCQKKISYIKADAVTWKNQIDFLNQKLNNFTSDTSINKARKYISDKSAQFATQPNGIVRISVPTGAGKTLSTLRYALENAMIHKKQRIFFIVPLLSVLEQNASVIRENVKDSDTIVSEFHSNIVKCNLNKEELDKYELVAQTLDSPIVITTLVQLLNMLFSGKSMDVRRMKSLCNSVIVIDEVQSVPYKLLYMFNLAIDFLAYYCNCSVVLSSATQPCFEAMNYQVRLPENCEMVPYNKEIFKVFKRTEIVDITKKPMTTENLADFSCELIDEISSLLIICNTKKTAKMLFQQIQSINCNEDYTVFHLSTSMCPAHRAKTLNEINKGLQKLRENSEQAKKIICVSTQLVEAGVDFSFESVIRVMAGLDNIAQSAGRCNRNGEFNKLCKVYIAKLVDENLSMLKDISNSQRALEDVLYYFENNREKFDNDLLDSKCIELYYKKLLGIYYDSDYFNFNKTIRHVYNEKLFELLSYNDKHFKDESQNFLLNQSFKTAGSEFSVFDNDGNDIIVPYDEKAKEIINDLCSEKAEFDIAFIKQKLDEAKPYTIQVYTNKFNDLCNKGMVFKTNSSGNIVALLDNYYNGQTGFDEDNLIF